MDFNLLRATVAATRVPAIAGAGANLQRAINAHHLLVHVVDYVQCELATRTAAQTHAQVGFLEGVEDLRFSFEEFSKYKDKHLLIHCVVDNILIVRLPTGECLQ